MGEALISRAGGGEAEQIIPVTPGYHTILATLLTPDNIAITNQIISCKDGSTYYNYTTNEKGQAMFVCNSGSANFLINNVINGISYIDIANTWINVDAPVGLTQKINLKYNTGPAKNYTNNGNFAILCDRPNAKIIIEGGGGGGGAASTCMECYGGGSGYINTYTGINKGIYRFIKGIGGAGARGGLHNTGSTGGTSYIENTNMSATGGTGGRGGDSASPGQGYKAGQLGKSDMFYDGSNETRWNSYRYFGNGGAGYFGNIGQPGSERQTWNGHFYYYNQNGYASFGAGDGGSMCSSSTWEDDLMAIGQYGGNGFLHFESFE